MNRNQEAIEEIGRIINNWIGAGPNAILSAQSRESIYDRLFSLMGTSPEEMRKMLNAAWEAGIEYGVWEWGNTRADRRYRRYRDVSKILAKKKEQRKDA